MELRAFHDEQAERLLLGCALRDFEMARTVVPHVRDEDIQTPKHKHLLAALREAVVSGDEPILEAVRRKLLERGTLDELGGYTGLEDLAALAPTSLHWASALNSCRGDAYRRAYQAGIAELVNRLDAGDAPGSLQRRLFDLGAALERWLPGFLADATIETLVDRIRAERARRLAGETSPLTWGLYRLDKAVELRRGALFLVVGDSSHLKSSLLLHATGAMLHREHRVLVLALEEGPDNWLVKLGCRISGVPMGAAFAPEYANPETLRVLEDAEDELRACRNLVLADLNRIKSVGDLASHVEQYRPEVVLVDYLQLFPRLNPRENEEQHLSRLGQELQRLAATSGVAIVAVSSINRAGETRDGKPSTFSIRGSHGLVHSPHAILGIYYPRRADGTKRADRVEIAVLKNKTGPTIAYSEFFVEAATCRFFDDENKMLTEQRGATYVQGGAPF
jgi:replicative DNA helicase